MSTVEIMPPDYEPDDWASIPIIRARPPSHFSVPHKLALDNSLSLVARGLMFYLLSDPQIRIDADEISRHVPESRERVRRAMRELREAGYITTIRTSGGKNKVSTRNLLNEFPQVASAAVFPAAEYSAAENSAGKELRPAPTSRTLIADPQRLVENQSVDQDRDLEKISNDEGSAVRTAETVAAASHDPGHEGLTDPGTSVRRDPVRAGDFTVDEILKPPPRTVNAWRKENDLAGDYAEPVPKLDPPLTSAERTALRLAMVQAGIPVLKGRYLDNACAIVLSQSRSPVENRAKYLTAAIYANPACFTLTEGWHQ